MTFHTEDLQRPLRLDRYIASKLDFFTREQWKNEITDNRLLVNGKPVTKPNRKIHPGDTVQYLCRYREEPEIDANYSIIHEDQYIIAVNKTGDLPVHPSGIYYENTLLTLLEKEYNTKLFLIHRLDRETSGTIIVGKSSEAAREFQKSLKNAQKTYNAIVFGDFPDHSENSLPLGPAYDLSKELDINQFVKKKRAAYKNAPEKAYTRFEKLKEMNNYTLVKALPSTGRLHQIRVHLSSLGFPIVGDKLYGFDEKCYLEFLQRGLTENILSIVKFNRCLLHAINLEIDHPFSNKRIQLSAPLPDDMTNFIKENS